MKRLCLIAMLALTAAPAAGEPLVRMGTSYYYIDGGSALVLMEQINQKGPAGADGGRYPTRTKWDVQWRFRHNMHDGVCKMEEVAVAVGVTTIRPRWRSEAKGAESLQARWKKLNAAVDRNQQFQTKQARQAGEEIEQAIKTLAPAKTCDALTQVANQTAEDILKKYRALGDEYDRRTQYGRTDGASLI